MNRVTFYALIISVILLNISPCHGQGVNFKYFDSSSPIRVYDDGTELYFVQDVKRQLDSYNKTPYRYVIAKYAGDDFYTSGVIEVKEDLLSKRSYSKQKDIDNCIADEFTPATPILIGWKGDEADLHKFGSTGQLTTSEFKKVSGTWNRASKRTDIDNLKLTINPDGTGTMVQVSTASVYNIPQETTASAFNYQTWQSVERLTGGYPVRAVGTTNVNFKWELSGTMFAIRYTSVVTTYKIEIDWSNRIFNDPESDANFRKSFIQQCKNDFNINHRVASLKKQYKTKTINITKDDLSICPISPDCFGLTFFDFTAYDYVTEYFYRSGTKEPEKGSLYIPSILSSIENEQTLYKEKATAAAENILEYKLLKPTEVNSYSLRYVDCIGYTDNAILSRFRATYDDYTHRMDNPSITVIESYPDSLRLAYLQNISVRDKIKKTWTDLSQTYTAINESLASSKYFIECAINRRLYVKDAADLQSVITRLISLRDYLSNCNELMSMQIKAHETLQDLEKIENNKFVASYLASAPAIPVYTSFTNTSEDIVRPYIEEMQHYLDEQNLFVSLKDRYGSITEFKASASSKFGQYKNISKAANTLYKAIVPVWNSGNNTTLISAIEQFEALIAKTGTADLTDMNTRLKSAKNASDISRILAEL